MGKNYNYHNFLCRKNIYISLMRGIFAILASHMNSTYFLCFLTLQYIYVSL